MDQEQSRELSQQLLAVIQDARETTEGKMAAIERLFSLSHGFWQTDDSSSKESFRAFTLRVAKNVIAHKIWRSQRQIVSAEDVADELLIVFIEDAHTIKGDPRAWLIGAALRIVQRLAGGRSVFAGDLDAVKLNRGSLLHHHRNTAVDRRWKAQREALNGLKGKVGKVMRLRHISGLSIFQISADLNMSEAAVRQALSRGWKKLEQLFSNPLDTQSYLDS